jgi:hypothetical protein
LQFHPIEINKEMFAVQCGSLDEGSQTLAVVRGMALNGELDARLVKASKDIRVSSKVG